MSASRRYRTAVPIGQGATGEVVRAWDSHLGRAVALKLLNRLDAEAVARLEHEARAQARVDHPHVARVYDVGELDGRPYISMQLVDGEPLDVATDGLGVDDKIRLFLPVLDAVQAAHAAGLIHRDLKPSNILVERREGGTLHPWVLDFGVSRAQDVPGLTLTGEVLGTPLYMSPEQARGATRELDRRSDLFSLGIVLYELLSGVRPFEADSTVGVLIAILERDPRPLRHVAPALPTDLEAIVGKCLEKDPERRYPSLQALSDDLERYLNREPITARPPGPLQRLERWIRRHRVAAAVLAVALVALPLLAALVVRSNVQAQRRALSAQRFGREAERIQSILRRDYTLPLHDVRPAQAQVRERIVELERQVADLTGRASLPGHYALGRAYLALGKHEAARQHLERAVKLGADDPETAYALGLALCEIYHERLEALGRVRDEEVRERLEAHLRLSLRQPALAHLARARGSREVSPLYVEGVIAFYEERWDEAAARGREAAESLPWFYEARELEGDALTRRGRERTISGDFAAARRDFESAGESYSEALQVGRSDPRLHAVECQRRRLLLVTEMMSGNVEPSAFQPVLESCERAVEVDPESARSWQELANFEWRWAEHAFAAGDDPTQHVDRSIAAAERALELEPDHVEALTSLATANEIRADALMRRDQDPEPVLARVIAINEHILELAPLWERSHASIASALRARADRAETLGGDPLPHLEAAIRHWRSAIGINSIYAWHGNLSQILLRKAALLAARGESALAVLEESIVEGRVATEQNPDYYGYWSSLAQGCLLGTQLVDADAASPLLDEGLAAVERALAIHPTHEESLRVRAGLMALRDGRAPGH